LKRRDEDGRYQGSGSEFYFDEDESYVDVKVYDVRFPNDTEEYISNFASFYVQKTF
jgi:hypothetical protein